MKPGFRLKSICKFVFTQYANNTQSIATILKLSHYILSKILLLTKALIS